MLPGSEDSEKVKVGRLQPFIALPSSRNERKSWRGIKEGRREVEALPHDDHVAG